MEKNDNFVFHLVISGWGLNNLDIECVIDGFARGNFEKRIFVSCQE